MLRLADSENLDRGALGCAIAGALCIATGSALSLLPPHIDLAEWVRWTGPVFIGVAGIRGTWRDRIKGALLGAGAAITTALFGGYPAFGAMIAGGLIGIAVSHDAAKKRQAVGHLHTGPLQIASAGAAAIAWPLVLEAVRSVDAIAPLSTALPPILLQTAAGGAFGLLMGMTPAPLHLEIDSEQVALALRRLRPTLDGELRTLVLRIVEVRARALKLLEQSRADVDVRRETKRGLDGVALMAIELTERFAVVDHVLTRMPLPGIEERVAQLRTQLESASDTMVRRDLERALAALNDQRTQVERLLNSRQRLVARLQSELASLEKTEMSLALLISGDAAVAGLRLESIGSSLGRQAQELEAEGSALQEALALGPAPAVERAGR
jgi:hypothetical protein